MTDEKALTTIDETGETLEAFITRTMFKGIPRDTLALTWLWCQRYDLDPVLKHVVVMVFTNQKTQAKTYAPYITRDGLLHVAHRSEDLAGMTTMPGQDELGTYAECTVWRKSMSHPFIYRAYRQEYDTGKNVWRSHPIAMLIKCAEVMALRRAFDVSITPVEEMGRAEGAEMVLYGNGDEDEDFAEREAELNGRPPIEETLTLGHVVALSPADEQAAVLRQKDAIFNDYEKLTAIRHQIETTNAVRDLAMRVGTVIEQIYDDDFCADLPGGESKTAFRKQARMDLYGYLLGLSEPPEKSADLSPEQIGALWWWESQHQRRGDLPYVVNEILAHIAEL